MSYMTTRRFALDIRVINYYYLIYPKVQTTKLYAMAAVLLDLNNINIQDYIL